MRGPLAFKAICAGILGLSHSGCGEDRVTLAELTSAFGMAVDRQSFSDESFVATFHPKSPDLESATFSVVVGFNTSNQCLSYKVDGSISDGVYPGSKNLEAFFSYQARLTGKLLHCYATFDDEHLQAFDQPRDKTRPAG
jgi:hypothetical protein